MTLSFEHPSDQQVDAFLDRLAPDDLRRRFGVVGQRDPAVLRRRLGIGDPETEIFLSAEPAGDLTAVASLSPVSAVAAEVALIVRSDVQHRGIGTALLRQVIRHARDRHLAELQAVILHENTAACRLVLKQGFRPAGPPGALSHFRYALDRTGTG